ncbi:helix-turn-helix transcriptional regulator [Paenibacillus aquistagni]|uniref:Transcriptional regulator, AraC family n=1 Tax=Paenibacillus aquistagni TaxID=1852522 RepID=A0A1X7J540_9BACL|nr:AraC family transcriptional regulator [Paenibacillus aquistagni]SMG22746.1 transcriptional regulator, AraC family [Paenibacillus aquistagni]
MAKVAFYRDETLPFLEGKRCHKSDLAYQKHFHEEYSIGLIDEGETKAWCEGALWQVEAGRMISFPPHMLHACQPAEDMRWRYKMLFIQPEWFTYLDMPDIHKLNIPFLLEHDKNTVCRNLLNHTMRALSEKESSLEIETSLIELVQALVDKHEADVNHSPNHRWDKKYVNLIRAYIHEHYTDSITLDMLENEAGISRYHLIRMFKRSMHLPPHAYQNLLRINHAKKELKHRRSIADIAIDSGYYDQSHFSKAFARIVGTTPHAYIISS